MSWSTPKTNWDTHPKAIEPADMNRIEGNIEVVRGKSDLALRLEVVDSFPSHAPGRAIYHTGDKKAYVSDGNNWMPFASPQLTKTYTPGATEQTIEEGYHKNSVVKGDADLIAANIKKGVNIFGVNGNYEGYVCPSSGYLYYYGNECVPWEFGYADGLENAYRAKEKTSLVATMRGGETYLATVYFVTSSRVDLTNWNELHIKFMSGYVYTSVGRPYLRIHPSDKTGTSFEESLQLSRPYYGEDVLDISDKTGLYYIKIGCHRASIAVFQVWLT
jgi:hypothetical protein